MPEDKQQTTKTQPAQPLPSFPHDQEWDQEALEEESEQLEANSKLPPNLT